MDHPNLVPVFLFDLSGLEVFFSILNLLFGIVEDEPSYHGLASSVIGITYRDIEP